MDEYYYPVPGERLENYQPGLEFYSETKRKWVPSGVQHAVMRDSFTGLYRKRISASPAASGEE